MDEWFKHYFIDNNAIFFDFEELAKAISSYEQDANNQQVIARSGQGVCQKDKCQQHKSCTFFAKFGPVGAFPNRCITL
jgi:hypothetical protein